MKRLLILLIPIVSSLVYNHTCEKEGIIVEVTYKFEVICHQRIGKCFPCEWKKCHTIIREQSSCSTVVASYPITPTPSPTPAPSPTPSPTPTPTPSPGPKPKPVKSNVAWYVCVGLFCVFCIIGSFYGAYRYKIANEIEVGVCCLEMQEMIPSSVENENVEVEIDDFQSQIRHPTIVRRVLTCFSNETTV